MSLNTAAAVTHVVVNADGTVTLSNESQYRRSSNPCGLNRKVRL